MNKKQPESLDTSRIDYLLNPELFQDVKLTVVGLGSGGAPVVDNLSMNGISHWSLFDPDILEPVNLVKHPRRRADLGRPKVDIQKDWIVDRNPDSVVQTFQEDVIKSETFEKSVVESDLVLSCADTKSCREYVSDICVKQRTPFVTASVFRTGIGGEVFSYQPDETGCYSCLQLYSMKHNLNLTDDALGLTDEEQSRIYGMNEKDFRASGLSIDIQMISLIQARMAISILLKGKESVIPTLKSNWIIFANRPAKGIFRSHFESQQFLLRPQVDCYCSNHVSSDENVTSS